MTDTNERLRTQKITDSCYFNKNREGEQFVREHIFSYQLSGTFEISNGITNYIFKPGDYRLIQRNHLVKFSKNPAPQEEFRSISVHLDQETLRRVSAEQRIYAKPLDRGDFVVKLKPQRLFESYIKSLSPYHEPGSFNNSHLEDIKVQEAIIILLQYNPELKDILFDFSDPGKIDLRGFMEKNFHFNVQLSRFAYLSGRSLATFKRDFEKIFNSSPARWLQQRRLQEAFFLIKEKGKTSSEIYLDLGFEDLSHFTFAFKNKFGITPSKL